MENSIFNQRYNCDSCITTFVLTNKAGDIPVGVRFIYQDERIDENILFTQNIEVSMCVKKSKLTDHFYKGLCCYVSYCHLISRKGLFDQVRVELSKENLSIMKLVFRVMEKSLACAELARLAIEFCETYESSFNTCKFDMIGQTDICMKVMEIYFDRIDKKLAEYIKRERDIIELEERLNQRISDMFKKMGSIKRDSDLESYPVGKKVFIRNIDASEWSL